MADYDWKALLWMPTCTSDLKNDRHLFQYEHFFFLSTHLNLIPCEPLDYNSLVALPGYYIILISYPSIFFLQADQQHIQVPRRVMKCRILVGCKCLDVPALWSPPH